jgi:hypothetical protein
MKMRMSSDNININITTQYKCQEVFFTLRKKKAHTVAVRALDFGGMYQVLASSNGNERHHDGSESILHSEAVVNSYFHSVIISTNSLKDSTYQCG